MLFIIIGIVKCCLLCHFSFAKVVNFFDKTRFFFHICYATMLYLYVVQCVKCIYFF